MTYDDLKLIETMRVGMIHTYSDFLSLVSLSTINKHLKHISNDTFSTVDNPLSPLPHSLWLDCSRDPSDSLDQEKSRALPTARDVESLKDEERTVFKRANVSVGRVNVLDQLCTRACCLRTCARLLYLRA